MKGTVYLVGAGTGSAGLITVRGKRLLERADVVVYDRLISPRLLNYLSPHARTIYVGKVSRNHVQTQSEIMQTLISLAREGANVVRLKGGDPYVFGRGGEEAQALEMAGVSWEVVPGVTSAVAALAYGGIPITFRGVSSSFTVVTGHEMSDGIRDEVNWNALARTGGTLVIIMGVERWESIADRLIKEGLSLETPAAVVQWGATAQQQTIVGSLSDLSKRMVEAGLASPAVIVLGDVVQLHSLLAWHERRTLAGKRFIVAGLTQADAAIYADQLEDSGAEVFDLALIEGSSLSPGIQALAQLWSADTIDAMVFTPSGLSVKSKIGACLPDNWKTVCDDVPHLFFNGHDIFDFQTPVTAASVS